LPKEILDILPWAFTDFCASLRQVWFVAARVVAANDNLLLKPFCFDSTRCWKYCVVEFFTTLKKSKKRRHKVNYFSCDLIQAIFLTVWWTKLKMKVGENVLLVCLSNSDGKRNTYQIASDRKSNNNTFEMFRLTVAGYFRKSTLQTLDCNSDNSLAHT